MIGVSPEQVYLHSIYIVPTLMKATPNRVSSPEENTCTDPSRYLIRGKKLEHAKPQ